MSEDKTLRKIFLIVVRKERRPIEGRSHRKMKRHGRQKHLFSSLYVRCPPWPFWWRNHAYLARSFVRSFVVWPLFVYCRWVNRWSRSRKTQEPLWCSFSVEEKCKLIHSSLNDSFLRSLGLGCVLGKFRSRFHLEYTHYGLKRPPWN